MAKYMVKKCLTRKNYTKKILFIETIFLVSIVKKIIAEIFIWLLKYLKICDKTCINNFFYLMKS